MRAVYRLLGLARRYGDHAVNTACERALALDVVNVTKIDSMLQRAAETAPAPTPRPVTPTAGRFARDPGEYAVGRTHLRLVHNADAQPALPRPAPASTGRRHADGHHDPTGAARPDR